MKIRSLFMLLVLAALVSGCQSTWIRSAWFDTDFTGPPLRKIVVVAGIDGVTDARNLEDAFAARLRAAGVDGVAGHTVAGISAAATDAAFADAVTGSGAQGLLLVRLLGVDTRTQVSTTMVQGGMGWGRGPWGPTPTRQMVPVQQVRSYELATVETKVFNVQSRQLIWAATTSTFNPRSIARETPAFTDLIVDQLRERGIITAK